MQGYFSLVFACIYMVRYADGGDCVPHPDGFQWKPSCKSITIRDPKIKIKTLQAYQNDKRVIKETSLGKILTLQTTFDYKYKKPIKDNRFDLSVYHYRDEGDGCQWYKEDEIAEYTSNINACKMIKKNCAYEGKPNNITAYIDIMDVTGVFKDMVIFGDYYGIEVLQRDGPTKLSCFWMQNLMTE